MPLSKALAVYGVFRIKSIWKVKDEAPNNQLNEDEIFFRNLKWLNDKKGTIERSVKELKYFRLFVPKQHPHDPCGELLQICLTYENESDLNEIFALLEIENHTLEELPDSYYQKFTDKYFKEDVYTSRARSKDPILGHGSGEFKGNKIFTRNYKR